MSERLTRYRAVEARLYVLRFIHAGAESGDEDPLLDEMEALWMELSPEERRRLDAEGSRCWPMAPDFAAPDPRDMGGSLTAAPAYDGFVSATEAILAEVA